MKKNIPSKMSFQTWMGLVDLLIRQRTTMGVDDIDDWSYRDAYDRGVTPKQAASRAIQAAKVACGLERRRGG